jgi:hypothetical protein
MCPLKDAHLDARMREWNWWPLEGDIDTSHCSLLHTGKIRAATSSSAIRTITSARPTGTRCMLPADTGHLYYRFAYFVLPF